uniref:Uncharacterized protein n=1 Tax=Oryza brachyantha TaxID=4533 RepID=J3L962_ORYBR
MRKQFSFACLMLLVVATLLCTMNTVSVEAVRCVFSLKMSTFSRHIYKGSFKSFRNFCMCILNNFFVHAGRGGYNSVNPDGGSGYNSVNPDGRSGYNSVNPNGRSGYNSVNPNGRSGYNSVPTNGGGNP